MLSRELEETLRRAMSNATDRNHEFATLEHLLLRVGPRALLDESPLVVLKERHPIPKDEQLYTQF